MRWDDEYANGNGGVSPLRYVSLYADGRAMLGKGKVKVVLAPGERVKRPAPKVLDADGVEIREGDTVYTLKDHRPYTVEAASDTVAIRAVGGRVPVYRAPWALTHEQPDTWERIENDATRMPGEYCERYGIYGDSFPQAEAMACDLVRRCRALAERGE